MKTTTRPLWPHILCVAGVLAVTPLAHAQAQWFRALVPHVRIPHVEVPHVAPEMPRVAPEVPSAPDGAASGVGAAGRAGRRPCALINASSFLPTLSRTESGFTMWPRIGSSFQGPRQTASP